MQAKVVITDVVGTKSFVGADKFEITKQKAVLHTTDGQVRLFEISLGAKAPYPAGEYSIADSSLEVGRYKDLAFAREITLLPLKVAAVQRVG